MRYDLEEEKFRCSSTDLVTAVRCWNVEDDVDCWEYFCCLNVDCL